MCKYPEVDTCLFINKPLQILRIISAEKIDALLVKRSILRFANEHLIIHGLAETIFQRNLVPGGVNIFFINAFNAINFDT